MAIEFYQTKMGQKYYMHDLPKLIESQNRLAAAIEKQNKLAEDKSRKKKTLPKNESFSQ